jgi:signal transduction histidine kinase
MLDEKPLYLYYPYMPNRHSPINLPHSTKTVSTYTTFTEGNTSWPIPQTSVFIVDTTGKILWDNPLARKWFTIGSTLTETFVLSSPHNREVCQKLELALEQCQETVEEKANETIQPYMVGDIQITAGGQAKRLRLALNPLESIAPPPTPLIFCELIDLTSIENTRLTLLQTRENLAKTKEKAGKIVHELNGPLDGTLRYLNLTQQVLDQNRIDKAQEYLNQGIEGLHQLMVIAQEMTQIANANLQTRHVFIPVSVLIKEAVQAIRMQIFNDSVEVITKCQPEIPPVRQSGLQQVLSNVIKNAFDAMDQGGTLIIEAQKNQKDELVITFTDDGTGIASQDMPYLFDPFFTTRDHGTGLGLSICHDILMKVQGTIQVEPRMEKGACFRVTVPLKHIT